MKENLLLLKHLFKLKKKNYKHMTSISKHFYINKSNDIVSEYSKTYHRAIKIKPIDVKDNIYWLY